MNQDSLPPALITMYMSLIISSSTELQARDIPIHLGVWPTKSHTGTPQEESRVDLEESGEPETFLES